MTDNEFDLSTFSAMHLVRTAAPLFREPRFSRNLIVTAAQQVTAPSVAIALPTSMLLTLHYTAYSAGYDKSSITVTKTVPSRFSTIITGLCMIAVSTAIIAVLRRRERVALD